MKKILKYITVFCLSLSFASCDKVFDSLEGDLSKMSVEDMLSSEPGIIGILAQLYNYIPMTDFSVMGDRYTMYANYGREKPEYSSGCIPSFWNYSAIREINKFLEALDAAEANGVINHKSRLAYQGEALFIRAYCYFASVRVYGGVPIVTQSLDKEYDGGENLGLYFPRSTEKETWDWIIDQLEEAAEYLPDSQSSAMRVNKYSAYALESRVALWAASESKYWNQAAPSSSYNSVQKKLTYMEPSYADAYYNKCIESASKVIASGKYALFGANPANTSEATNNLVELFANYKTTEGLIGKSYKSGSSSTGNDTEQWAPRQCTPDQVMLAKYGLTLNLVDEFDYINEDGSSSDGKIKTLVNGDESYIYDTPEELFKYSEVSSYMKYDSADGPFINKEPRFHAWVIYPDCVFRGVTVKMQAGMITPDKQVRIYPIDNDGVEFNGTYYYPYGGAEENNSAFYHLPYATGATVKNCSYAFLVKKHLEPASATNYPQTPWYDMRYAEVLLNYAEAVVENGSGYGDKALAKRCLNEVRHRAGFKDDIELSIENVLHEEKVEFAFENVWPCILYRRRAFNNPDKGICIEGAEKKLTLLPIVDLSGDEAKYIFIRATSYFGDVKRFSGVFRVRPDDYYLSIPNYINNKIEDNNK